MTMLDDDLLASLLTEAARSFDLPADGPAAIIARARGGDDDPSDHVSGLAAVHISPLRRVAGVGKRHRLATVAACVVALLVALAAVGALTRPASRHSTSSQAHPRTHGPAGARLASPQPPPQYKTAGPASASSTNGAGNGGPLSAHANPGTTSAGAPYSPQLPSAAVGRSSRIEQTGTLALTVRRGQVNRTVSALTALAGAHGGFVANSQTQSGANGAPYGNVTLEVPVDSFAAVLKQAETLGRPSGVSTKATDVTGQYVDLQARIAALQSSRQQYLSIMARATTIGEVLSVQEQIDNIQSQMEQLQGQLQVLTNETSYSTLTATVNQASPPAPPSPVPESGLVQAWHQSLGGFVDGVDGVVRLAGPALFALACLAGVLVGGRVLWRRYRRHSL
jgi:hypothetical protein